MARIFALACAAAALGGCVSIEEAPIVVDAIKKDQKTVVLVYASPGPVMSEDDSMTEQVAKVIPGVGFLMKATQNTRDLEASQHLSGVLPDWRPEEVLAPVLLTELARVGYPGRFFSQGDVGLSTETLRVLNRAADVIDWQLRYCGKGRESAAGRDYASLPPLNDALVLEINLALGAPSDGHGRWTPTLTAVTKLLRPADKFLLWRHEDSVADKPGMKAAAFYSKQPADLISSWRSLMPALASSISTSLNGNLQLARALPPPAP